MLKIGAATFVAIAVLLIRALRRAPRDLPTRAAASRPPQRVTDWTFAQSKVLPAQRPLGRTTKKRVCTTNDKALSRAALGLFLSFVRLPNTP